jgi:CHAD domain-containing protein
MAGSQSSPRDPGARGEARFAAAGERELVEALERAHGTGRIVHGRAREVIAVELDTFDHRLDRRGARVVHESDARGESCRLRLADGRQWRLGEARPDFAHDLAEGAGRAALGALAGERRLLAGARRVVRRRALRLLDREGKTVVRVELELERDPERGAAEPVAVVQSVRGYAREHARLCARLEQQPGVRRLRVEAVNGSPRTPEALPREVSAAEGLAVLLERRLQAFLAQEPGLRADLDPEFNHDARVAVRRTRSLLGELGRALPEVQVDALREELRWLGGLTGPLRDLDVLLLELRKAADLPPRALRALRTELERRRDVALAELRAGLDTPRYDALVAAWRELAESGPPAEGPGARPFRVLLAKRLRKRSQALLGRLRPDVARGPVADLHALRIQAKKLRYLLECTHGLVDERHESEVTSALKRLQERLGALNDAAVQTATLEQLAAELAGAGLERETWLWLGRLCERAACRVAEERAALPDALAGFSAQRARKAFEKLVRELDEGA